MHHSTFRSEHCTQRYALRGIRCANLRLVRKFARLRPNLCWNPRCSIVFSIILYLQYAQICRTNLPKQTMLQSSSARACNLYSAEQRLLCMGFELCQYIIFLADGPCLQPFAQKMKKRWHLMTAEARSYRTLPP